MTRRCGCLKTLRGRIPSFSASKCEKITVEREVTGSAGVRIKNYTFEVGFTYLQSMDFQREPQSKHHLYCEQEKPAHCHGSLLLRLGTVAVAV